MKIDPYTKTITLETEIDNAVCLNYLTTCLTKKEAREWKVKKIKTKKDVKTTV